MLQSLGLIINIFLITIILLRTPEQNSGLTSFATKTDILGSPNAAKRRLNKITAFSIILFFSIAINLNLANP